MYYFIDRSDEVSEKLDELMKLAMTDVGVELEGNAKAYITKMGAVYTGFLKNSITYGVGGEAVATSSYTADKGERSGSYSGRVEKVDDASVSIGSNVEYARFIEMGTSRNGRARPFIRFSIQNHISRYKQIIENTLHKLE